MVATDQFQLEAVNYSPIFPVYEIPLELGILPLSFPAHNSDYDAFDPIRFPKRLMGDPSGRFPTVLDHTLW